MLEPIKNNPFEQITQVIEHRAPVRERKKKISKITNLDDYFANEDGPDGEWKIEDGRYSWETEAEYKKRTGKSIEKEEHKDYLYLIYNELKEINTCLSGIIEVVRQGQEEK